jgi:signal transduction histidine kinase
MSWAETTHAVTEPARTPPQDPLRHDTTSGGADADGLRELVATVNHELRTPLTCIHGALSLLELLPQDELSPQVRHVLHVALRNSERLIRLVDVFLDLERIESGFDGLELRAADVALLLQQARDMNEPYASEHRIRLVVESAAALSVRVDEDRFFQILTNLISNAVKFSPAGGCVRLTATAQDDHVRIAVSDQGPGIPESFRSRVFERFARGKAGGPPGTGLGLSITKTLVTRMGGRIWFETAEGAGTTFFVDVPTCPC